MIIGKYVVKFVFEVSGAEKFDFVDYDVQDFFAGVFKMKSKLFDWKESDEAKKWMASQKKKGLEVLEVDDYEDTSLLIALKLENWPTMEYVCKNLIHPIEFIEPELG